MAKGSSLSLGRLKAIRGENSGLQVKAVSRDLIPLAEFLKFPEPPQFVQLSSFQTFNTWANEETTVCVCWSRWEMGWLGGDKLVVGTLIGDEQGRFD